MDFNNLTTLQEGLLGVTLVFICFYLFIVRPAFNEDKENMKALDSEN